MSEPFIKASRAQVFSWGNTGSASIFLELCMLTSSYVGIPILPSMSFHWECHGKYKIQVEKPQESAIPPAFFRRVGFSKSSLRVLISELSDCKKEQVCSKFWSFRVPLKVQWSLWTLVPQVCTELYFTPVLHGSAWSLASGWSWCPKVTLHAYFVFRLSLMVVNVSRGRWPRLNVSFGEMEPFHFKGIWAKPLQVLGLHSSPRGLSWCPLSGIYNAGWFPV